MNQHHAYHFCLGMGRVQLKVRAEYSGPNIAERHEGRELHKDSKPAETSLRAIDRSKGGAKVNKPRGYSNYGP